MKKYILILVFLIQIGGAFAETGYQLWLHPKQPKSVKIVCSVYSPLLDLAKKELIENWQGNANDKISLFLKMDYELKEEGYKINNHSITARSEKGILYGVYELLRRQQTHQSTENILSNPSYQLRVLNHWDNMDGSVERGYAGNSIFWRKEQPFLVTAADQKRWKDYARANASIGINGSVINNVNASPLILTEDYLKRVKKIADVLRTYGIKTFISVKFSSPALIGGLKTSDPLDPAVRNWWKEKVKEIYALIPDFGGLVVKANSEGQPGPQDFHRTHADGANMLAEALNPYHGIVMWRAFVYSSTDNDRAKQAYAEFIDLDGKFHPNVILQVKNGPVDFQPREPFSPLFGAIKNTSIMPEFQITQEYLGQNTHLVFLSTMWQECLQTDTYQAGKGSTVAGCTDGSIYPQQITAIAGVSNIGRDENWCGHPFAQANWYAFGRLSWNNKLLSSQIAEEWIQQTFTNQNKSPNYQEDFLLPIKQMMLESREAAVDYMTPLGLHHIMAAKEHYGPGPWWAPKNVRADWTPPYYHRADSLGIGFDRSSKGTNAVSQYQTILASQFDDLNQCNEKYLLWFHHVAWNYPLKNGNPFWKELCLHYDGGVKKVAAFQRIWLQSKNYVDPERFTLVQQKLQEQFDNAILWKDACLLFFQRFSKMPFPKEIQLPKLDLDELIKKDMAKHLNG